MNFFKIKLNPAQIESLIRKDLLVRWRQPWMTIVQFVWPCMIFSLLFLIRLKYGEEPIDDCQFPSRMLPTTNNVLPAFYTYICSIENRCSSTKEYEEEMNFKNAPMKPIIDIVQLFINNDNMFNSIIDLPEKRNFIGVITTLFTSGHLDEIRHGVTKVIDLVPKVEQFLNGTFDIKRLFSDRQTFVKGGYLLCGHPFPSTESIPLVNDIIYSEDFSEVNDDELNAMPTKYCKRLYLDVTSSNHGKLTWQILKPIIQGKILYAPDNEETKSIMQHSNSTFTELNRLRMLSVALEDILTKLREDEQFQKSVNDLLKLAQSPFVRSLIGEDINIDQIESVLQRIRTDPIIYDVFQTIRNILQCFSVDRFVPLKTASDLRKTAYDLNGKRLFYAAVFFNKTEDSDVVYKLHMDVQNTQPTIENKNRFWFPGPSRSMVRDLRYHRGFIQIKQSVDLGIIKHKKELAKQIGTITEKPSTTTQSPFRVQVFSDDDGNDEDDDDWFANVGTDKNTSHIANIVNDSSSSRPVTLSAAEGIKELNFGAGEIKTPVIQDDFDEENEGGKSTTLPASTKLIAESTTEELIGDIVPDTTDFKPQTLHREKRQSLFGMLLSDNDDPLYNIDNLKFYTKQFPYPAYIHDDFKTGVYLAQAVQCAFFLGLVVQIATSVRHRIWMRESRNLMIMCSMGLEPSAELASWVVVSFGELVIIFASVTAVLYIGGIMKYTLWLFVLLFLVTFSFCLIAFCFMCSTFFTSATIGAVATALLFFISFCPYIIVLMFDAKLNSLQNFGVNLSFTTAFAHAWNAIMRMELQQDPITVQKAADGGLQGEFGFSLCMILLDMAIYVLIGSIYQYYKNDEFRFVEVPRAELDRSVGATMTDVSKIYDNNKMAVANISLSFAKNQVTCLLGRNGAGKSTIIKMLTGQVAPTSGRVVLAQSAVSPDDYDEYDKVGVCAQDNILIPHLTAREHLELYAKMKIYANYNGEVERTLRSLKFGKHENYQACQLSGGFQRRLCVAIAFICSPNVVILDEPCNGVDTKARKDIWDLIEILRKGRAVVFATHFLDEAEHLSDVIVIMKNGKIIAKQTAQTMKSYSTDKYELSMECADAQVEQGVVSTAATLLTNYKRVDRTNISEIRFEIAYSQRENTSSEFMNYLQELHQRGAIRELNVESHNLEQMFTILDNSNANQTTNGNSAEQMKPVKLQREYGMETVREEPLTRWELARHLFGKRLVHLSRNYRMLLCVLILPAVFELLAMWFVSYRLEDDFDRVIKFSRNELYPNSMQMLSLEVPKNFTQNVYGSFRKECYKERPCKEFKNAEKGFYWILESLNAYRGDRYGGYTFNDSKAIVWYNNKGYHAMMAWLNDLNSHLLQTELNDSSYSITSYNEPWKLGYAELSTSSVLRQAGDSCMVFILVIAFSFVIAAASVYLVNERVKGEKLQQRLCGVDAATYWGVAFVWDFLIILLALLVCISIILAFGMSVFVARQQLWGIIVLSLFFGFACIPGVHVVEKLFSESSLAIVTIFCMNLLIPLFTMAFIVLLGVVGDTPTWDEWRYFFNRAFLIFPQHALGDGLLEICKNYLVADIFRRYDIDSYKNPVNSDLLRPHLISLAVVGIVFLIINMLLESGLIYRWRDLVRVHISQTHKKEKKQLEELRIISIQNSLKRSDKYDAPIALKVNALSKTYGRGQYAVKNVTFELNSGECLGLLGKNGAGKSTIFKILSGQLRPSMGAISYYNSEISYCPQTNMLDSLLTVTECIRFYGELRRIIHITDFITSILEFFQLEPYRDVLVKNLSGGNRRKLTVATACCGRTSVVLMDEPTSDMDPVTRVIVYRTIQDLLAEQRGIVLTSHSISEIDDICHRIAVLKDGQMLTCSSPESLKVQYGGFYNIIVYPSQAKVAEMLKSITRVFPQSVNLQHYVHSIKFSIKVNISANNEDQHVRENGVDVPDDHKNLTATKLNPIINLAQLFQKLEVLSQEYGGNLRYSINRCRLDAVFENILDSSDSETQNRNNLNDRSIGLFNGSSSTGYVHNGYVETETVT